ncbi:hypothetical protein MK391_06595 [Streptococcus oralis]|jgi:hypothetical protein|uniref:Cation diffusion facilitator family transporter n=2 Tax=Bacteria TaxID=2 RepID=A0A1S0ZCT6_SALET|nr:MULTISPECIES: hypothetical protein [Streptococcus]ANR75962.1 hypothetical protein AXF18_08555 [Streptococcus sp. oral taxon 064]ATF56635.1 hypothetical protein CO686_04020 [Streptococcus oralis]MBT3115045.1 hypothetical protein [Streptococcus oralis]MCB7106510.1 hypothetical protein [Streptococcus oralis]MCC3186091.1 hypothetical protein [Streptococcus oralis]
MANENKTFELQSSEIDFDYEQLLEIENSLENNLKDVVEHIEQVDIDREKLQNNEYLQESIENIVWEQVQLQLAAQIGEEFIKDNNGQTLDLRKDAHIQTAENFEKGKLATHNRDVDYQERYDTWQNNFVKDDLGNIKTHSTRSGKIVNTLTKDARKPFDAGRPTGSKEKGTQMDHTVSAGEIIRDPKANAFLTKEEQIAFANSKVNLNEIRSEVNQAKGDQSTTELFDNPNSKGQYAREVHNISSKEEKQLIEKDKEAREEYDRVRDEAEKRAIKSGKKSRRDEALKVSGKAFKAALLQLLSEFLRELISKFISWLKETERNLSTFIEKIKEAIISFVNNLSNHLLNVGKSVVTMIASAIVGPVINTFLKAWTFIHQGWKSLKEAIDYLNNPDNKEKSVQIMMLEIGKIVVAGLSATGAIVLGETLGASLTASFPVLAVSIPLLGTIGSVIGTFMGATLSGIIGAFVLKMIDQQIVNKQITELSSKKIDQNNEMLVIKDQLLDVKSIKLQVEQDSVINTIKERHDMAASIMKEKLSDIFEESTRDEKSDFDEIDALLQDLLD